MIGRLLTRWRRLLVRWILRARFGAGGAFEGTHPPPRLLGADVEDALPFLAPGDFVLTGSHARLTHVAVHMGDGVLVHAMGTEHTQRGWRGSIWDVLRRPFHPEPRTGVIEETWTAFFDRYPRDVWVAVRVSAVDAAGRERGLARVRKLVGEPYDYAFRPGEGGYYCTEVVLEYLRAALGEAAPTLPTVHHRIPFLLEGDVYEPEALLHVEGVVPIASSRSARLRYAREIRGARRLGSVRMRERA